MSKVYDFLKSCNFYYLLTIDSDYPAGRPISGMLEADGTMYFGTRKGKAMYQQLSKNNRTGLLAFNNGRWLRIYADVEETNDASIREQYLSRLPAEIKRFGSADNPLLAVFAMHIVKADLHTGENSEDIDIII
ncbi:MAG: pyridoxamine 5'-phosphate oxidase family protein [Synergistaceae bacterium]|nr:pyridoxamine 5'-phosphate oxidase family protein [Synergistaceae bacterium]